MPAWGYTTDLVVDGSGAGGMGSALSADQRGIDAIVVETRATIGSVAVQDMLWASRQTVDGAETVVT